MTEVALKGHRHICPMVTGNVPHVGGPIIEGDGAFTVNGIPVALQGHRCSCQAGGDDVLIQGCSALTVNGIPVVLKGSATAHGGIVIEGSSALTVG